GWLIWSCFAALVKLWISATARKDRSQSSLTGSSLSRSLIEVIGLIRFYNRTSTAYSQDMRSTAANLERRLEARLRSEDVHLGSAELVGRVVDLVRGRGARR